MEYPSRKNIRLRHWDYSNAGCYHVTICTHDKAMLFGSVIHPDGAPAYVDLSDLGAICEDAVSLIHGRFPGVQVLNHIVMPNHVHLLLSLQGPDAPALGCVVQFLKAQVTREARLGNPDFVVWQARYHDHIVRGEADFLRTWEYIDENPIKWGNDEYFW